MNPASDSGEQENRIHGNGRTASNCAILILSCDAYSDLWTPFFTLLKTNWPDCPYAVYLGAGAKPYEEPGVTVLRSDGGKDWSKCVLDYLSQISAEHVLLMLDDFFLRRRVDTKKVEYCLGFARAHDACQVRLIPFPGPNAPVPGERLIGYCTPDMHYRVSAQAAIWNKAALRKLLNAGENAWTFEHNATERARADNTGYYAVRKAVLPYQGVFAHHVIEKGLWLPQEKWIFRARNIGCDFGSRGTLGWKHALQCLLAAIVIRVLGLLPCGSGERLRLVLRRVAHRLAPGAVARLSGRKGGQR